MIQEQMDVQMNIKIAGETVQIQPIRTIKMKQYLVMIIVLAMILKKIVVLKNFVYGLKIQVHVLVLLIQVKIFRLMIPMVIIMISQIIKVEQKETNSMMLGRIMQIMMLKVMFFYGKIILVIFVIIVKNFGLKVSLL